MPEYQAPGVYVEEVEIGAKPIEGVSTSIAGFLGETERGPTNPRLITGLQKFRQLYGGYFWTTGSNNRPSVSFLPYVVEGFFANGGKKCFISRIVGDGSSVAKLEVQAASSGDSSPSDSGASTESESTPANPRRRANRNPASDKPAFTIQALGPGDWGNRIKVKITDASLSTENKPLFKLVVSYSSDSNRTDEIEEDYDNLSPDPNSPDFFQKRINSESSLVEVEDEPSASPMPKITEGEGLSLTGGISKTANIADFTGKNGAGPGKRKGLAAFEEIDEISIVCAPNENDHEGLSNALVTHCENMKDRFAILQSKKGEGAVEKLRPPTDSKYAAYYYPWIRVMDPATRMPKLVPPGGHISGIYSRTDIERGVHKAPANEVVRGAVGLEFSLTKGEQDILNPRGVNCIRAFSGRGVRVWGARTISSDPLWKYVNVRRLMLFIEESIEEASQWVVFEPNDQKLWGRVTQTVVDFLTRVWKDGALMGNTPEEAFFVKCDETTMTQNDLENGRLIILIGVAPVRPAEFVIFRLAQWRGGSAVME